MTLTSDFFADPLGVAGVYAIHPADEVEGYKGKLAKTLDTSGIADPGGRSGDAGDSVTYARVMRGKKVAHVELSRDARIGGTKEGVDVVNVRTSFGAFGEAMPAWFLPWEVYGGIIRLTIPPKGTVATDPDIFFTAAINGCSVFVQGEPDNPTIYHAGGDTGRADQNDAARMWRHALMNHIKSSASARGRGAIKAEVNKTHYIKTPGTQGNASTPLAESYEAELKRLLDTKGQFTVEMVAPWGCVFGVRTGTDWAFYLQENATVFTNYVTPTGVRKVQYARPMKLTRIYPGGQSLISSMKHIVPVKIT